MKRTASLLLLTGSLILAGAPLALAAVGTHAPDFTLPAAPGGPSRGRFRLADHVGQRPVVILFWATWCQPCTQELPVYQALYARYGAARLTVVGISMDNPDNAVDHLARALVALGDHEWPVEIGPSMTELLSTVSELTGIDMFSAMQGKPEARMLSAAVRNTTNATIVQAGFKHNVIPADATAYIDGRFLPGHQETFQSEVQRIVGDRVTVEPYIVQPALEYDFRGDLIDAMTVALNEHDPGAVVAPYLMSGGTDAKAWDRLGITSYGFAPLRLPEDLDFTALFHGIDERVPIDALEFGARVFDRFLDLA
jgi:acetylornithine deacetylase/succinyl-diaminopimelate desuccinylase-like protein